MEVQPAIHEASSSIIILAELYTAAQKTHLEVGRAVRQTIKDLGGTMPEDLPTPDRSINQLKLEQKKLLKEDKRPFS